MVLELWNHREKDQFSEKMMLIWVLSASRRRMHGGQSTHEYRSFLATGPKSENEIVYVYSDEGVRNNHKQVA